MHEAAGAHGSLPRVEVVGILVDLLAHEPAGRQRHWGCEDGLLGHAVDTPRIEAGGAPGFVRRRRHGGDGDLQAAVPCLAGELLLGGVALAQGHRDELPDQPLLDAEAVQPRLLAGDKVVLRFRLVSSSRHGSPVSALIFPAATFTAIG